MLYHFVVTVAINFVVVYIVTAVDVVFAVVVVDDDVVIGVVFVGTCPLNVKKLIVYSI